MEEPLISIIVPIYNVQKYLSKCLDSLIHQTYQNIQIILIDDGSVDDCGVICDEYRRIDNRIIVVHQVNQGLVSARKSGVRLAKGDYIGFVDGDDWINENAIEKLVLLLKIYHLPDVVAFGYVEEYPDHNVIKHNMVEETLYEKSSLVELKRRIFMGDAFWEWRVLPPIWGKLIKSDLLKENIMHIDKRITFGEDVALTYPCLLKAESVLSSNHILYHYRQREGSIVKAKGELPKENFIAIYRILSKAFQSYDILKKQLKYYMFFSLLLKAYSQISGRMVLFPFEKVKVNNKILVYGAGGFGTVVVDYIKKNENLELVGWVDQRAAFYQRNNMEVDDINSIKQRKFDYIVIAILNEKIAKSVQNTLVDLGVPKSKIDYVKEEVLSKEQLPKWIYNCEEI